VQFVTFLFIDCDCYAFMQEQKTMDEVKYYYERKINLLKSNFEQLVEVPFLLRVASYCVWKHCLS